MMGTLLPPPDMMTHASAPAQRPKDIQALTGFRFLAAAIVLMFHSGAGFAETAGLPEMLVRLLENGYLGLSFFFVLSGFVLTYSHGDGVASLRLYAASRVARIYPVYLLSLIIMLPLAWRGLSPKDAAAVLLMIQSWSDDFDKYAWIMQAWSISVEAFFYASFPLLIALIRRFSIAASSLALLLAASIMVAFGLPAAKLHDGTAPWLMFTPLARLPEFLSGMLLCQLLPVLQIGLANRKGTHEGLVWLVFAGIVTILATAAPGEHALLSLTTVLCGALIMLLSFGETRLAGLLSRPGMLLLGGASYAEYLLQGPVREWLRVMTSDSAAIRMAYPLVLFFLSILVFRHIETPVRRLLLRLASPARGLRDRAARPRPS